jgi:tetratricopeptide (TPR) repeat protein
MDKITNNIVKNVRSFISCELKDAQINKFNIQKRGYSIKDIEKLLKAIESDLSRFLETKGNIILLKLFDYIENVEFHITIEGYDIISVDNFLLSVKKNILLSKHEKNSGEQKKLSNEFKKRGDGQDRVKAEEAASQKQQENTKQEDREFKDKICKAFTFIENGKLREALKIIKEIGNPENSNQKIEILKIRAKIYEVSGLSDELEDTLEELLFLLELNDDTSEYFYMLAILYENENELEKAKNIYKKFIDNLIIYYKDVNQRYKSIIYKLKENPTDEKPISPSPKPLKVEMDALTEKSESFKEKINRLSSQGSYFSDTVLISKTTPIKIDTSHQISIEDIYDSLSKIIKSKGHGFNIFTSLNEVTTKYGDIEKQRKWIIIRSIKDMPRLALGIGIVITLGKLTLDIYIIIIPEEKKETEASVYNSNIYQDIKLVQNNDSTFATFIDAITDILNLSLKSIIEDGEVKKF